MNPLPPPPAIRSRIPQLLTSVPRGERVDWAAASLRYCRKAGWFSCTRSVASMTRHPSNCRSHLHINIPHRDAQPCLQSVPVLLLPQPCYIIPIYTCSQAIRVALQVECRADARAPRQQWALPTSGRAMHRHMTAWTRRDRAGGRARPRVLP